MGKKRQLYIYGVALLVISICRLIILVLNIIAGDYDMLTHEEAIVQAVANGIIITVLVSVILSILIGAYLGIKGILESKNPTGRNLHIVISRAVAIINLVLAVIMGLALIGTKDLTNDFSSFALCFADTILMYEYAKVAKAIKNGEE